MAKKQKSKLLAMALCASVMAGLYANPVFAGPVEINYDAGKGGIHFSFANESEFEGDGLHSYVWTPVDGVLQPSTDDVASISGEYTITSESIAQALNGQIIENLTINNLNGFNVADLSNLGGIKREEVQNPGTDNEKGRTVVEGILVADSINGYIANTDATFIVDRNGHITASNLKANGRTGGWYVEDIALGNDKYKTMIYAASEDGASTLRIDPENGNLSTKGTIAVGDLDNPTTIIDGETGDIAVGITGEKEQNIHLDADTGNITTKGRILSKGDITSTAADGKEYSLNNVGKNTSGIISGYDGRVTTIEGAFSVNENGYIYNKNGSFKVTRDGAITASSYNGVTLATYGEKVLVGDIDVSEMADNTEGIVRLGETTTIEKTVSADKWGLKVLNENGETVASINSTNGGINAANGKFHVYSEGQIEGTALSLMNNGAQNVYIDNSGTARFGAVDGNNVRVEDGVLTVNRNSGQVAALSENGLTLTSSNDIRATLNAEQIANLNSTIKEGSVVDAKELNVTGATGGLYVKDVTNDDDVTGTMIYTKAADGKTNTMWIDPNTGNLSTVGTIGVGFANGLNNQPTTILDKTGDINVGISYNADGSVAGQKINLDAETGNITLADKATVDGVDVSELSKNVGDIGADLGDNGRLGGITRTDKDNDDKLDTTTIEGTTSFDANGMRVTNEKDGRAVAITKDRGIEVFGGNGASNAVITNNGTARFGAEAGANVRIENGDVTSTYYDEDGKVGHYSLNNIGDKTQNMWADGSQTNFSHSVNVEGSFSAGNGGAQLNGAWDKEAYLKLRDAGNKTYTLTATQLGNINNVILENGVVNGAAGSNIGDVRFSGGGDLNNVNHINGAAVQGWGEGGLEISGVAMENGAIKVTGINGAAVNAYGEGGLEISGVGMLNGNVSAQTFNGVSIEQNEEGSAVVGGIDLDNLNENLTGVTEDVAGISRDDGKTTNIEGRVFVSKDEFYIGGYGDGSNWIRHDETGTTFGGKVTFNNGYNASFWYGDKQTTLGDLAYNLDDLTEQVQDIYDRTQGINRDENGNTVISNDNRTWENGQSIVTDNGGATVTVGEDVTVAGGDLNVANGDLNVGYTEGSGTGGTGSSATGEGGNGNFAGDVNVGGSITVGDASDGVYTQVGESGLTAVNGNDTNNISSEGMTVTGDAGVNNISDAGMTITGTDGSVNNISSAGMTVGTTNIAKDSVSADKGTFGEGTFGSGEDQTVINNDGVTVGDKNDGTSIKHDEISVGDGGYIGGGDVVSGEGVSLNQTAERVGRLENKVGKLEDRIDKVGAMAAAIANLRTMGYDPAAPTEVAVGIGQYRDETGAALGLFHYPNRDFMLSLSVSTSGDEVMGGIGATWKFGRKSPEKVAEIKKAQAEADARRAEEAKLAKAEEMKQAAKEAKIKAQQERHAKLAAERAAQAEAAK